MRTYVRTAEGLEYIEGRRHGAPRRKRTPHPADLTWTLAAKINVAKRFTHNAATVKDWRCRSKKARELRAFAREIDAGRGYLYVSPNEIAAKFGRPAADPRLFPDCDKKFIYCVLFCAGKFDLITI